MRRAGHGRQKGTGHFDMSEDQDVEDLEPTLGAIGRTKLCDVATTNIGVDVAYVLHYRNAATAVHVLKDARTFYFGRV